MQFLRAGISKSEFMLDINFSTIVVLCRTYVIVMITGWSNSKSEGFFPEFLKRANTTRVHKKNDPLGKENYRPVSILPLFSNVYERTIFIQLPEYMQYFSNEIICGFRKSHSAQQALFKLFQAWQRKFDKWGMPMIAYPRNRAIYVDSFGINTFLRKY